MSGGGSIEDLEIFASYLLMQVLPPESIALGLRNLLLEPNTNSFASWMWLVISPESQKTFFSSCSSNSDAVLIA